MDIDWQTVFYVVSVITMLFLLTLILLIGMIFRRLKQFIDKSVANATTVGSLAKLSVLRMLLKIIR